MGKAVPADDLPGFDLSAALAETDKVLGLPSGLSAAQIRVESGMNPRALSKAGAMGLAQVMPDTLKAISSRLGRELDPYNPEDAVAIHREVMRENLAKFKDPSKALMAYNGGWDQSKWGNPETSAYVGKVRGAMGKQSPVMAAVDAGLSSVSGNANAASKAVPADDLPASPTIPASDVPANDGPGKLVSLGAGLGKGLGTVALNAQRYLGKGLGAISSEGTPGARAADWLVRDADQGIAKLATENRPYAEANPITNTIGEVGGNIVGTAPVGGLLGKAVGAAAPAVAGTRAAPAVNALSKSLETGGFRIGPGVSNPLAQLAIRGAGGAAVGGISAGLTDPESAGAGAVIGAALPAGAKVAGMGGNALRRLAVGEGASPEVAALAKRAAELGINIPADRIVNSKPLNALASGLNYVPFSGRAATEAGMESQMNRALSRTFGQDSDNVTQALRKASDELGAKFDEVLKNNSVAVDDGLLTKLAEIVDSAKKELGSDGLRIIENQIDELLNKGASGQIDGQAAYNIKRTLDRIGKRATPEAYQARQIKGALMEALDRSLGPDAAKAFATTRQQYGNMLALENLAQNGAEGGVSIARLANMKNINNRDLQELADIAAQFVKAREGQHGAMQRGVAALGLGGTLGLPGLAGTAVAGRATNMLLNAEPVRNALLRPTGNALLESAAPNLLTESLRRAAPILPSQGIQGGQR